MLLMPQHFLVSRYIQGPVVLLLTRTLHFIPCFPTLIIMNVCAFLHLSQPIGLSREHLMEVIGDLRTINPNLMFSASQLGTFEPHANQIAPDESSPFPQVVAAGGKLSPCAGLVSFPPSPTSAPTTSTRSGSGSVGGASTSQTLKKTSILTPGTRSRKNSMVGLSDAPPSAFRSRSRAGSGSGDESVGSGSSHGVATGVNHHGPVVCECHLLADTSGYVPPVVWTSSSHENAVPSDGRCLRQSTQTERLQQRHQAACGKSVLRMRF